MGLSQRTTKLWCYGTIPARDVRAHPWCMENALNVPSLLILAASLTTGAYFLLFVFRAKPSSIYADTLPDINSWKSRP